jgi:hypothetical protein
MKRFAPSLLFALAALGAAPARAGLISDFRLDLTAWYSTEIVVAVPTPKADTLTVVETWRGSLEVGAGILVRDLPHTPESANPSEGQATPKLLVDGRRMVLFLTKPAGHPGEYTFARSSFRDSLAFVQDDQVFVYRQIKVPGPAILVGMGDSEETFHKDVQARIALQDALAAARALPDLAARTRALGNLAANRDFLLHPAALDALVQCGPAALPALHALLHDPAANTDNVVFAIAAAAGPDAPKELTALLHEETTWWIAAFPTLPPNWADAATGRREALPRPSLFEDHLHRLSGVLYQLHNRKIAAPPEDLALLQAMWTACPLLYATPKSEAAARSILDLLDKLSPPPARSSAEPSPLHAP